MHIEVDPERKSGAPVIRGTRLSERAVLARLDGGDTIEDLVEDYPYIEPAVFAAAAAYARAHRDRVAEGE